MQDRLFRENAIEHQKCKLHGDVLIIPAMSHTLVVLILTLWLVAVFAWLVTSQYARQETVAGWLEPPSGIVKVFSHQLDGKIQQVLVNEGQQVTKGQSLVIVNGDRTLLSGSSLQATLLQEYATQKNLINEQLGRLQTTHSIAMRNIQRNMDATQLDLSGLESQISTLKKRQDLIAARYHNYQQMRLKGHVATIDLDRLLEQKLALQSDAQALLRERANLINRLQLFESELITTPQNHLNDSRQLKTKLSELSLNIAQLSGQQSVVIKASRDGVVANLQAKVGHQVAGNTPLLSLIPINSVIQAKLLIPVKAAGFIEKGQQLEVRYDAFPYQKFGLYQGTITQISDTVLLPGELDFAPLNSSEPVYLVYADLQSQTVSAYGKPLRLKSGMTLSADVTLSERTLFEWVLDPILSLKGRM
ncbi:HlyD family secretion protein [Aliiglaciecola litoralis]|uniref:HlyD family efflux transporter periplasmic adaptor subunit n=1 Tax=Aliiglaciecola litoralis TaxID=582857 RepID=A0ABP3X251_9ALTE